METVPAHEDSLRFLRRGATIGTLVALAQSVEMLAGNPRTINPTGATALVALWLTAGAAMGAASGWLGGRAAVTLKRPGDDGAAFLSALVAGHFFLPLVLGPMLAALLVLNRVLRRRLFPRMSRLDSAIPVGLVVAAAWVLMDHLPPPPPRAPDATLAGGTPLPGSVPVTISVHSSPRFPEVPAVHLPLRPLASAEPGLRAALWSGRAPLRTRTGPATPRRLPGGAGVSWIPARPGPDFLARLLPAGDPTEPPFRPIGTLPEIVAAAGIPVLQSPPSDGDPQLFLRILEDSTGPDLAWAEAARQRGAWIDVMLGPDGRGRIALSGVGIEVKPSEGELLLMDVLPTALHLLGLAIPRNCDGRVLMEHLDAGGPGRRDPRYRGETSSPDPEPPPTS